MHGPNLRFNTRPSAKQCQGLTPRRRHSEPSLPAASRPSSASRRLRGHGVIFSSSTGSRDRAALRLTKPCVWGRSWLSPQGRGRRQCPAAQTALRCRLALGEEHWRQRFPRHSSMGCPGALDGSWGCAPRVPIAAVRTARCWGSHSNGHGLTSTCRGVSMVAAGVTVPPPGQDLPLVIPHRCLSGPRATSCRPTGGIRWGCFGTGSAEPVS